MWRSKDNSPLTDLYKINSGLSAPSINIIFVHGLDGDAYKTWNFQNEDSWSTWIFREFPNAIVWSLKYRLKSSNFFGGAMALPDRGLNVLHTIKNEIDISLPILFICHSYGGLLVKQVLRSSRDFPKEYGDIALNTFGVCFFSTPHQGAGIADYIAKLKVMLPSSAVRELKQNEPNLRNLNLWFRNHPETEKLKIKIFYEGLPTNGVFIVDAASADIGLPSVLPISIDSDHINICKPPKLDGRVKEILKIVGYAYTLKKSEYSTISPMKTLLAASNVEIPFLIETFEGQLATDPGNIEIRKALNAARNAARNIDVNLKIPRDHSVARVNNTFSVSYIGIRTIITILVTFSTLSAVIGVYALRNENASPTSIDFSELGDRVRVGCQEDGTSRVAYSAPSGYYISNAFTNVQDPRGLRSYSARIVSNDGKTVIAVAEIRGLNKEWTGNCPSSGSGQVKVYGKLTREKGFFSRLFEKIT